MESNHGGWTNPTTGPRPVPGIPMQGQVTYCLFCTDKVISGAITREEVRPMFTYMPLQQSIPVGIGQAMPFMVPVPSCFECRQELLSNASTSGGLLRG